MWHSQNQKQIKNKQKCHSYPFRGLYIHPYLVSGPQALAALGVGQSHQW